MHVRREMLRADILGTFLRMVRWVAKTSVFGIMLAFVGGTFAPASVHFIEAQM